MKRPTSITVIAWIMIISVLISLISVTYSLDNPQFKEIMGRSALPLSVQITWTYLSFLIQAISAAFMLKGKNWSRWLYVIWNLIGFINVSLTSPVKTAIIPNLLVFGVFTFFLFRPKANAYFTGQPLKQISPSDA